MIVSIAVLLPDKEYSCLFFNFSFVSFSSRPDMNDQGKTARNRKKPATSDPVQYRLTGLVVLFALAAIFIPMLLHEKEPVPAVQYRIPTMPIGTEFVKLEPEYMPDAIPQQNPVGEPTRDRIKDKITTTDKITTKVATRGEQQAITSRQAWTLKLATFSMPTNAIQLVDKLQNKGFKAYSKYYRDGQNKTWQIVYVGPTTDKSELEQLSKQIAQAHNIKGQIIPFEID